jgi:TetR/AcrR family transcriptional regulator, cholesterol catabolism regulator
METFLKIFVSYGKSLNFDPNFRYLTETMVEIDEKKHRILEDTGKLILKYGVKSMTMDDIARELGMSKKTLYLYFNDKNDLIKQVIQLDMKVDHQRILAIVDMNLNAIDESFEIFKTIVQNVGDVPPNILYDLKKYHPDAYLMHREFMWKFSRKCVEENLIKGISEGYYRQDINTPVISTNYQ